MDRLLAIRYAEVSFHDVRDSAGMRPHILRMPVLALALTALCCNEKAHQGRQPADAQTRPASARSDPEPLPPRPAPPPPRRAGCPRFSDGQEVGKVESVKLTEASGLVSSRVSSGVLWAHNDAPGRGELFAMDRTGRDLGKYSLNGTTVDDLEDIALGPGPGPDDRSLYVGDIGASKAPRDTLVLIVVREPKVNSDQKAKKRKIKRKHITRYLLRYPDRAVFDAETLMVDPETSDVYVATKTSAAEAALFRAKAPLNARGANVMERVAWVRLGPEGASGSALLTGGDIAPDGSAILLRTYADAFLWPRRPGEAIAEALSRPPCQVPLRVEPQGEAIAFSADGRSYLTVSEGTHSKIFEFVREQ